MNEIIDGREIERDHLSGRDVVIGAAHAAQILEVGGPAAHTVAQTVGVADAAKVTLDLVSGKEVRALDVATAAASVTLTSGVGSPAAQLGAKAVAAVGALDAGERAVNTAVDTVGLSDDARALLKDPLSPEEFLKDLGHHRAIEKNRDDIAAIPRDALTVERAQELVWEDAKALRGIQDKDERLLAALAIEANASRHANYKNELLRQDPEVSKEVEAARGEVDVAVGQKEDRKASEGVAGRSDNALDDRFVENLDARLGKSELKELGWRDRNDLDDVFRDLERLAAKDWQQAAELWEKYRPGDIDKPSFIDGDDVAPESKHGKGRGADSKYDADSQDDAGATGAKKDGANSDKEDKEFLTPESLRKRYIESENKFYFRDEENKLAFEDKGKRLSTEHNDPEIARSMVELAQGKDWKSIKVKGADEFKRVVWLEASLRGIQVEGFKPNDVDLAKLHELRQERGAKNLNSIEQGGRERERQSERSDAIKAPYEAKDRSSLVDEQQRSLSSKQQIAIDTLKTILRERGDSEKAVEMASKIAAERFHNNRVYVGKVLEHGSANYEFDAKNEASYYVKLQTNSGEKLVWGVDLQRAVGDGKAEKGDDVAIAYQGKRDVTVNVKEKDAEGKLTGKIVETTVPRNTWDVSKLDKVREEAKERLSEAARNTERQPVVNVYDRNAPRSVEREVVIREPAKDRQREHAGRG